MAKRPTRAELAERLRILEGAATAVLSTLVVETEDAGDRGLKVSVSVPECCSERLARTVYDLSVHLGHQEPPTAESDHGHPHD